MEREVNWTTEHVVKMNTAIILMSLAVREAGAEDKVAAILRRDIVDNEPGDVNHEAALFALDKLAAGYNTRGG